VTDNSEFQLQQQVVNPFANNTKLLRSGNRTAIYLIQSGESRCVEKRLQPFADVSPERQRLAREARLQFLCAGPGVVPLYIATPGSDKQASGSDKQASPPELEDAESRNLFERVSFRREYIDGLSLRSFIESPTQDSHAVFRAIGEPSALRIARALISCLLRLHEKRDAQGRLLQVIHRDITPDNVLVDREGNVWLNDFGLSYLGTRQTLEPDEILQGTRRYLPPEVHHGHRPGVASDIYQWGLLLTLLLEAQHERTRANRRAPPHAAKIETLFASPSEQLHREAPARLRAYLDDQTLEASLHPDPKERPTARQLLSRLHHLG
jgi:serine/threonine protein kinase